MVSESKACDMLGSLRVGDDGEEEIIAIGNGGSREDQYFDSIVGAIEEILIDADFQAIQDRFCAKHCDVFEDASENKLEYTRIFDAYVELIEGFLERRLVKLIDDFDMDTFMHMCSKRRDELIGDVFDLLMSLGDFEEFKFLMLSYKAEAEGSVHGASSARLSGLCIS